ncbi:MAG: hypothetical protein IKU29_04910, partial [Parabacteroides sp.]|nr:hypothetical protein [Parabacteroides sp.]
RRYKGPKYTIGSLYIDYEWVCDTLEDVDRGLTQDMDEAEIKAIKVYGKTAIPMGEYKIDMSVISNKFKNKPWAKQYEGRLPRFIDVPGYEGVLIHVGNTEKDTEGCILVGYNKVVGQVINSTSAFHKLMKILKDANDEITIKII